MKKITLIATLMLAGIMQAQTVVISSTSFEEEVIEALLPANIGIFHC